MVSLVGISPKLDVCPVLFALLGYIQTLAAVHAHDPVVVAANLLQSPTLLRGAVPAPLYDVRSVIIPAALDGDRLAAAPADDGDFAGAEVYDVPVLVGLIGISPLSDVGPILLALPGHVQGFITAPVHDRAGVAHAPVRTGVTTVAAVITTAVGAIASTTADFEIGAAAAIHPDAVTVEAPGPPLHTGRLAPLIHQADDAASIDKVGAESPVVCRTVY